MTQVPISSPTSVFLRRRARGRKAPHAPLRESPPTPARPPRWHGRERGRCGDHLGVGKRCLDWGEAEVIVRVALADIDSGELLAIGFDGLGERLAVGEREAAIDQDSLAR
jgi:hypothetical protein